MPLWLLFVISGLAGARTWRVLAVDDIGEPFRNAFSKAMVQLRRLPGGKRAANSLIKGYYCPHCAPFWLVMAWLGAGLAWGDGWGYQLAAGSMGVSYVASHTLSRLDAE